MYFGVVHTRIRIDAGFIGAHVCASAHVGTKSDQVQFRAAHWALVVEAPARSIQSIDTFYEFEQMKRRQTFLTPFIGTAFALVPACTSTKPSSDTATVLPDAAADPMTRLFIAGDDAADGVFDLSIAYDAEGVGWMAYSGLNAPIGTISIRLARSDDKGASGAFVQVLNAASGDTVDFGGIPTVGAWPHEISTIVRDPTDPDPNRRWKVYWHEYLFDGVDSYYLTHGWLAARYAPERSGSWKSFARNSSSQKTMDPPGPLSVR